MSQTSYLDWFEPVVQSECPLTEGLDRVQSIEQAKLHFIRCLKAALNHPVPHYPDQLLLVQEELRVFARTLQHRLGMLAIDRPQAWFRHSPPMERGPFAASLHEEPVFLRFDEARASSIRHHIPELWKAKQIACTGFEPGASLWGRLLGINRNLSQINQLGPPFADVCLDELPEALPDELYSPALQDFCQQLAARIRLCQKDLQACYRDLWKHSESFLYAMHLRYMAQRAQQQQSARPSSGFDEALRFMHFSAVPDLASLRQRYRNLAQMYHPDRGGQAERFHLLTRHYETLLRALADPSAFQT